MKAYFLQRSGSATTLELREVPEPRPGPDQLLVRVRAASLNRGELLRGAAPERPGARPAGTEAAGEVEASGERVMGRCAGGFAEYALIDRRDAIPVPAGISWEEAAAIPIAYLVVHDMLIAQGALKAGEWLLVTAITSGVGVAALQVAKALGARVIGTSGSAGKLQRLERLGLDVGIQTRKADFHDAVVQATGGKGAGLAVNNVGGSVFAECVRSLAFEGRLATVGYLDGVFSAEIDLDALHAKRLRLFGVSNKLRDAEHRALTVRGFIRDLLPMFADGRLRPLVDRVYDFKDLAAAKAHVESDAHLGKVVLRVA